MFLMALFALVQVQSAAGTRSRARSPSLPLLRLLRPVLKSVLLLLNAHYCWRGRAPLNPAGATLAQRSECAALIPLPPGCLAWRHLGGGFRTDNRLWTVDFPEQGECFFFLVLETFLNDFNELQKLLGSASFGLEVGEMHFLRLKPAEPAHGAAIIDPDRSVSARSGAPELRVVAHSSPGARLTISG